ncbi:MAG TPA: serine protease [Vicinamibacterales bacterium]|nr:serine protease [Vicinamibacterales bacterium]
MTMFHAVVLATIAMAIPQAAAAAQTTGSLRIKVALADPEQKPIPIPRHVLLISDNPASAPPRRVITALDGTAEVQLRPGNYTVESDQPVAFQGKSYEWMQILDIVAGRTVDLELTMKNAQVGTATSSTATVSSAIASDPSLLLMPWNDSVFGIWTPTTHASGFLIDASGLIVTNQRAVGTAAAVEVQLTATVKVAGRVLATNADRDVALVRVDPKTIESLRPIDMKCGQPATKPVIERQEIYTIAAPLRQHKGMTPGVVLRVGPRAIESDFRLAIGGSGGPVFTADGALLGITSVVDEKDATARGDLKVIRTEDACEVVAAAQKVKDVAAPDAGHLPVEPNRPFPPDALKEIVQRRAGSLNPYPMTSEDFDIGFITPVLVYGAQYQAEQASKRDRNDRGRRPEDVAPPLLRPQMDFGNWSEYVADVPPVLMIRVTPKFEESFWTKVARGAAQTQGMAIPAIKRFKSGFSRLRAFCGDAEVTPIHPFKLEQNVSDTNTVVEGLYVFEPGALGPECSSVKLILYSQKEPDKADTRVVDPKLIQQIWSDFAPYRTGQ